MHLLRRPTRPIRLALLATLSMLLFAVAFGYSAPHAAAVTNEPCDIYGNAGTPCVSANSTVRALYSSYNGPLYQVTRASDGATTDVGVLSAGGYVNAATQDSFCVNTTCTISKVYDQSPQHNDLTIEGPGTAGGQDHGANATAVLLSVGGGHSAYGIDVTQGVGYRHPVGSGSGLATNGQAEGMYMVTGGMVDNGNTTSDDCCYDYGNVEAAENDTGAGHMDAIRFGTSLACSHPCTGSTPFVGADLENGIFGGSDTNPSNPGNNQRYVTAMLKNNGQTSYVLKSANAQSGGLLTLYNGALPSGYAPMHQEGSIVLGTGGDNSNRGMGTFFEGVITSGYPTDAADNAVQANIVAAGYTGYNSGTITGSSGKCMDVNGDDTGGDGAAVQVWDCLSQAADQHWYHSADSTLVTLGKCLGTVGSGTTNGTQLQLSNCTGAATQHWTQQANGSMLNVGSGRCIDDPLNNTTNGTRLQIWDCNGVVQQAWSANAGGPATGATGKCIDVAGDDTGGAGAAVQLWDCQWWGADQHWYHNANGSLTTLGQCLSPVGGGTTNGTLLELANCNGGSGQSWTQQANGSLLNAGSGRCVDDPSYNTANGTQLQIWDCNGAAQQQFALH